MAWFGLSFMPALANIRVHTGPEASAAAAATNSVAYALGNDIVFGEGRFSPSTPSGKWLIAHEIGHVVQQTSDGLPAASLTQAETDADAFAASVAAGEPAAIQCSTAVRRARQPIDPPGPEEEMPKPGTGAYLAYSGISMVKSDSMTHWRSEEERRATIRSYIKYASNQSRLKPLYDEAVAAYSDIVAAAAPAKEKVPDAVTSYLTQSPPKQATRTEPAVLAWQPSKPKKQPPPVAGGNKDPAPGTGAYLASHRISMVKSDSMTHWESEEQRRETILDYIRYARTRPELKALYDEAVAAYPDLAKGPPPDPSTAAFVTALKAEQGRSPTERGQDAIQELLRPAPTPSVSATNPLADAMAEFTSIHPSNKASGIYEGTFRGRPLSLTEEKYNEMRKAVRIAVARAIDAAVVREQMARGRYEEQQKVDAQHWIVAPIVKAIGRVSDPGPALVGFTETARTSLAEARKALDAGDFNAAARLAGDGALAAVQASKMVAAYVDQIIDAAEFTVTVLEDIKLASEVVFLLCAIAATGGAAGAAATSLGLEGAGATTTLFGVTGSTATWATAIGATAAITEEVSLGIMRAADGEPVDWGEIAVHAAIQIIVAKFSPGLGQRLSKSLSSSAVANKGLREIIARVGMARVVNVATTFLLHEGTQVFSTAVEDTMAALRGQPVTWGKFGDHLFLRLTDPKGLLMAVLSGTLAGAHPEASEGPGPQPTGKTGGKPPEKPADFSEPVQKAPPPKKSPTDNADWRSVNRELGLTKSTTKTSDGPAPKKSPTDNADWRDVNRALGLKKPRTKATPVAPPPPGTKQVTAEEAFQPTPAERAAAFAKEPADKSPPHKDAKEAFLSTEEERARLRAEEAHKTGPPLTSQGTPIIESGDASPKGADFEAASMKPGATPAKTAKTGARTVRADVGEAEAYKAALQAGEIGIERPQGANVKGRADFITSARDASGEMWIIANDAKTMSSPKSAFEAPKPGLRPGWDAQVKAAIDRASFSDPKIKPELEAAYKAGRIWVRQVNVNLSPTGRGAISGIAKPSVVPWGALLGPVDFKKDEKE
jgi:hypothetical protein